MINLYVSVTDEKCFRACDGRKLRKEECKRTECSHVKKNDTIKVTIQCTTCGGNNMTNYYWNKSKSKYKFGSYVENHTKMEMFKFAVPPGKYKIKCEKVGGDDKYVYPSQPQKR